MAASSTVKKISRQYIPRGRRTEYIAGIRHDKPLLERYHQLFSDELFSKEAIAAGEELVATIAEARREKWCRLVEDADMKQKADEHGDLIAPQQNYVEVMPNQEATQLLFNGKSTTRSSKERIRRIEN